MNPQLRIAIADDDRSARTILRKAIEALRHTVVAEVENGRDLVQQCFSEMPDVVITDNIMGDMTGLEAAAEIFRKNPLPIVLLSGFCDPAIVPRCRRSTHPDLSRKADCS